MEKVRVGVLGCGAVAFFTYLRGIAEIEKADMVAVCDIVPERAHKAAEMYGVPHVYADPGEMLASDIDLVVNLTPIQAHFETNLRALQAGKHVYSEKTFAGSVEQATTLIEEARRRGLRLGAAAATMLDPVVCKIADLLERGAIGKVTFAIVHHSHFGPANFEGWPTDPTWFYQPGAGPLVDLGVYGLHTLTGLLGPARAVCSLSGISVPLRPVRGGPLKGQQIEVGMDDNTLIMLDFGAASYAFLDSTYCVHASKGPRVQIYGSEGTIAVNERGAASPLSVFRDDAALGLKGWTDVELPGARRWDLPMGVEHLIDCILDPQQAVITSGEHARHVIEIMEKCIVAAREKRTVALETTFG
jgi:predicted dehydrogenase